MGFCNVCVNSGSVRAVHGPGYLDSSSAVLQSNSYTKSTCPRTLLSWSCPMQLAGELAKISLSSLTQLVRNGGLTGEIALSQGVNSATIFVDTGRIVHVESDMGSGRDALLELFLWQAGTFSFIEGKLGDIPRTFPVDEPMDKILREGALYLEQKKYLDKLRINGQTVLKPTLAARQVKDVQLLDRLDGRKTLAEALSDANLSRRAYIQAVYRLLSDGLAVVFEPQSTLSGDQALLPAWVVARLQQDNPDLSQSIVNMVIWVDRVKCWMYQADADMDRLVDELSEKAETTTGSIIDTESKYKDTPADPTSAQPDVGLLTQTASIEKVSQREPANMASKERKETLRSGRMQRQTSSSLANSTANPNNSQERIDDVVPPSSIEF